MTSRSDVSVIERIDHENRVIYFHRKKINKITGSKLAATIGKNEYGTPFSAACDIAGIYSEHGSTKYTEAGNILEPVMRSYLRVNAKELLGKQFDLKDDDVIGIEEPVPSFQCGYEHFPGTDRFGGMVDGYVLINGKRVAVLEIKTVSREDKWIDEFGRRNKVPVNYLLQASLYSKLSGIAKIVFVAGFLREKHYEDLHSWAPCEDNCAVIVTDPMPDINDSMHTADQWYETHIVGGVTPPWNGDDPKDLEIVDSLTRSLQGPPKKDLQELMEEYIEIENKMSEYDDTKKILSEMKKAQDALKNEIKMHMTGMLADGQKKVTVDQSGHTFTLSVSEGMKVDEEKLKNNGIYDAYAEKTTTYRITFN